jgi:predicted Zn finger-like uncharacterized protein
MIKIKCQNCTKVYLVPENKIGKSGRTVKCTSCDFTWYTHPYEKKSGYIILAALTCIMIFFIATNPDRITKPYKHLMYKLVGDKKGQSKEQSVDLNQFYQDYFLLSNFKSYDLKMRKEEQFD